SGVFLVEGALENRLDIVELQRLDRAGIVIDPVNGTVASGLASDPTKDLDIVATFTSGALAGGADLAAEEFDTVYKHDGLAFLNSLGSEADWGYWNSEDTIVSAFN